MRYRPLGNSGLLVSVVGLGTNHFGSRLDLDGTRAVVEAALDAGVTFFDTADIYGKGGGSETLLGHLNSGAVHDPNELNRAVVALEVKDRANFPFDDPGLRRVVVNPGAPNPVTFATNLIREALAAEGRTP